MKIDFSALTQSNPSSIFLYGTHEAYLNHKTQNLVQNLLQKKQAQVLWVEQADFLNDPSLLVHQGDLFSKAAQHKLIVITDATDKSANAIESHMESMANGIQLIVPAMIGSSIKKLKLLHEKAKNAAFTPCYLSTGKDKQLFLQELAQPLQSSLSREAQLLAVQQMEDNLEAVLSALQKLPLYVDAGTEITLNDFQSCMSDFREANVKPIVSKLGDRILSDVLRSYHEAKMLGAEEINILRSINQHFSKLIQLKAIIAKGTPASQAVQMIRPPIFFKEQDECLRHISKWSEPEILALLRKTTDIERKIKTSYPFDPLQLWKPIFSLCKIA